MRFAREVALVGLMAVAGCGQDLSGPKVMRLAREGGAVVSYKGLMFNINERVTGEIADELGILHIKGNQVKNWDRVFELLRSSRWVGATVHSAGSIPGRDFLKRCEKYGIEVRQVHSYDPLASSEGFDNVAEIYYYKPGSKFSKKERTKKALESRTRIYDVEIPKTSHIGIPRPAKEYTKEWMREDMDSQKYNRCSKELGKNLTPLRR